MTGMITSILSVLLTLFFLFASSIKITGWHKNIFAIQLEFFHKYGLKRQHMMGVGLIELYGAVSLWLPSYPGLSGALAILIVSTGAIYCHLKYDTWKAGIPAMVTFTCSGVLGLIKFSALV